MLDGTQISQFKWVTPKEHALMTRQWFQVKIFMGHFNRAQEKNIVFHRTYVVAIDKSEYEQKNTQSKIRK